MAINFVKFNRGSAEAYQSLVSRNRVDLDTLYFLYDKNNPNAGGDLYLGYTLISGNGSGSSSGVSNLRELADVGLVGTLRDGMILQYNVMRNKWVNVSIKDAIEASGASLDGANVTVEPTLQEGETVGQYLTSIVDPKEGDIAVITGQPYVYDGSDWVSLTDSSVLSRISALETQVSSLQTAIQNVRSEIDTKIANANHLTYRPLEAGQTLDDINTDVADISRTIFLVPNGTGVQGNIYDEYMYINNQFEKLGNWTSDLSGYVTTQDFNTSVTNLQNQINGLSGTYVTLTKYNSEVGDISDLLAATGKNSTTVIDELVDVYERLQWVEISTT